jgi:hypothetical protein
MTAGCLESKENILQTVARILDLLHYGYSN